MKYLGEKKGRNGPKQKINKLVVMLYYKSIFCIVFTMSCFMTSKTDLTSFLMFF